MWLPLLTTRGPRAHWRDRACGARAQPGIIIGVVCMIAYVGFFTIMLRKMYDYSQAVEVVRHFGGFKKDDG